MEFWKVAKLNDSILYQKSRDKWIREGDSNTKYFHNSINWRRRINSLRGLLDDGVWVEDPRLVKAKVKEFFEKKFKKTPSRGVFLDGASFLSISLEANKNLTRKFDLEEIRSSIWECEGDRSPGPDGYNFHFIKYFWHVMKEDIERVFADFHNHGEIGRAHV